MWLNTMIPKRGEDGCDDCMTLEGSVYCTMNCGPRVEVTAGKPCNLPAVETLGKTRIEPRVSNRLAANAKKRKG
jgi:hypothetical protein